MPCEPKGYGIKYASASYGRNHTAVSRLFRIIIVSSLYLLAIPIAVFRPVRVVFNYNSCAYHTYLMYR